MRLQFQSVKNKFGVLSPQFVGEISARFGLVTFIETGTYKGDTVFSLKNIFEKLVSIELSADLHKSARQRFRNEQKISIVRGDSAEALAQALAKNNRRALIWLDAHYSGHGTVRGENNTPIIRELSALENYSAGNDVILIDDFRLFWKVNDGFAKHDSISGYPTATAIVERIQKIGDGYDCFVMLDALLAISRKFRDLYCVSPVLVACTKIRLGLDHSDDIEQLNSIIACAHGMEADAIIQIPEYLCQQVNYGLGGHYYYYRALVRRRRGDDIGAQCDEAVARKCGVLELRDE